MSMYRTLVSNPDSPDGVCYDKREDTDCGIISFKCEQIDLPDIVVPIKYYGKDIIFNSAASGIITATEEGHCGYKNEFTCHLMSIAHAYLAMYKAMGLNVKINYVMAPYVWEEDGN